jgi:hypothetical protein
MTPGKYERTPEIRAKNASSLMGRKLSPDHVAKVAQKRIGTHHSPETILKMSLGKLGTRNPNYGKSPSAETRAKLSESHKGERCHLWKGGISFEPYCPKFNGDLKRRIRAFFDYRCVACGKPQTEEVRLLSCHHVEYNKSACCDGKPVHFAALCIKHHSQTNTDRERWENMLHRIIDEIYGGRSYFTKDEMNGQIKMDESKEIKI